MKPWEFYYDDDNNPIGLLIRHDNLQTDEYDDDHAVFASFVEVSPMIGRQKVTVVVQEPLTIDEQIECFCGWKGHLTNGEVIASSS